MAPIINLKINQGADFRHTFRYVLPDGTTPIPLTGFTARCDIRPSVWADEALYEATTETSGIAITDAANGVVVLTVPGSTSSDWIVDRAVYDIELIDPTDKPYRLVQGEIFISREVTR